MRKSSSGATLKYSLSQCFQILYLFSCCFFYMKHKEISSAALSFCNLCEENNNNATSTEKRRQAGRDWQSTPPPFSRGGPQIAVCFRAPVWKSVSRCCCSSQSLLRREFGSLTFTETPAASAGQSDRNAQRHFLPFFSTLRNNNLSYCYEMNNKNKWHFCAFLPWRKLCRAHWNVWGKTEILRWL